MSDTGGKILLNRKISGILLKNRKIVIKVYQ